MKINNLYYGKPKKAHQLIRSVVAHTVTMDRQIHLDMYKFWFEHWSSIDFANDLFDELTKEDMFEEYGEEKIMYAAKKKWVTFHYDDWYGQIQDIAAFECGADETGIVDMRFNAETLAQASKMLKGDKTYESDLKRVNELYVQTLGAHGCGHRLN